MAHLQNLYVKRVAEFRKKPQCKPGSSAQSWEASSSATTLRQDVGMAPNFTKVLTTNGCAMVVKTRQ